jgi:lipoyl(octanoyl) transferase
MEDLLDPGRFPVFHTGRGGKFTYHGPGQRVAYCMLDQNRRGRDVRAFIAALEGWVIDAVAHFNVRAHTQSGLVGVFVDRPEREPGAADKIAAVGIRLRRWVSLHGISLNVEPQLQHFEGIVPCGVTEHGMTSLADLGRVVTMHDVDVALATAFARRFGPTKRVAAPD